MRSTLVIFRRELAGYFATPLAYVFIVIFLAMAGRLTFFVGNFFERGQADLQPFFNFHPWLYLVLIPALAMRLWAEERKSGTIELFLTLPISMTQAVLGKFLAGWAFAGIALALTFPFWITVNYLGNPDNGVILAELYRQLPHGRRLSRHRRRALGADQEPGDRLCRDRRGVLPLHGERLADRAGHVCMAGRPRACCDTIASFSFLTHFNAIIRGVIDLRDAVFFLSRDRRLPVRQRHYRRSQEGGLRDGVTGFSLSRRTAALAIAAPRSLFVGVNVIASQSALGAHRPDAAASVHAVRRLEEDARAHRRADHAALLLFAATG